MSTLKGTDDVDCMVTILRAFIPPLAGDVTALVLLSLDLAVLAWCIVRLRAVPSDPSAPENTTV